MPSQRRRFIANHLYELELRTRSGLPFAALRLVRLLLASAMARTQRDHKVVITHFLWMSNHLHLLFVAKDAEQATKFYGELTKKITDYYKRLFALPRLELWEPGGPVLSEVLDLEAAKNRIAYLFANPSRADLVDSIAQYPGFSSWCSFSQNSALDEVFSEEAPWIRQPSILRLPSPSLTDRQDRFLSDNLCAKAKITHELSVHPAAAYAVFGVTEDDEVTALNASVKLEIQEREAKAREMRLQDGKTVLGAEALKRQSLYKPHTPKRKTSDRKVLFHTSVKQLALQFLAQFNAFSALCRDAYLNYKRGNLYVDWPPGAFRPPLCPLANAVA